MCTPRKNGHRGFSLKLANTLTRLRKPPIFFVTRSVLGHPKCEPTGWSPLPAGSAPRKTRCPAPLPPQPGPTMGSAAANMAVPATHRLRVRAAVARRLPLDPQTSLPSQGETMHDQTLPTTESHHSSVFDQPSPAFTDKMEAAASAEEGWRLRSQSGRSSACRGQ